MIFFPHREIYIYRNYYNSGILCHITFETSPFYSNLGPDVISHIKLVVLHCVRPSTKVHGEPHIASVQFKSEEVISGGTPHALVTPNRSSHEEDEARRLVCLYEGWHLWKWKNFVGLYEKITVLFFKINFKNSQMSISISFWAFLSCCSPSLPSSGLSCFLENYKNILSVKSSTK